MVEEHIEKEINNFIKEENINRGKIREMRL